MLQNLSCNVSCHRQSDQKVDKWITPLPRYCVTNNSSLGKLCCARYPVPEGMFPLKDVMLILIYW